MTCRIRGERHSRKIELAASQSRAVFPERAETRRDGRLGSPLGQPSSRHVGLPGVAGRTQGDSAASHRSRSFGVGARRHTSSGSSRSSPRDFVSLSISTT